MLGTYSVQMRSATLWVTANQNYVFTPTIPQDNPTVVDTQTVGLDHKMDPAYAKI
ncbi:MAG: hypothetical protein ACPGTU_04470 [Myxococcota bacterium]